MAQVRHCLRKWSLISQKQLVIGGAVRCQTPEETLENLLENVDFIRVC